MKLMVDDWSPITVPSPRSSVRQSFTWGNDLCGSLQNAGGLGGLLAIYDASTINNQPSTHFLAYYRNENVTDLVNASNGRLSAQYDYGPFGEVTRQTGSMADAMPFRFSTKYQDDETDMVLYPYRPYSPSLGRWLSRDPVEEKGGPGLYEFTGNSPTCLIDPDGRMTLREFPSALPQPPTKGPYTGYGGLTWFKAFEPKARVYKSIDGPCCWKVIVPGYADLYYWWVVIRPGALQHEMLHVGAHRDTYNGFSGSASRFVGKCYSEPKAKCYQEVINGQLTIAWLARNHTKNLLIDQSYRSGEIAQATLDEQSAWTKLAEEETRCEQIK